MKYLAALVLPMFFFLGCGGGGDSSDTAEVVIEGERAVLYSLYAEKTDDDTVLTEDEIDCSHPLFTSEEPLPKGSHPEELVLEGYYWDCQDSREYFHADGSVSAIAERDYEAEHGFWSVCMIGTEPPEVKGVWVVTQDGQLCARTDTLPGIVVCVDYSLDTSSDGEKSLKAGGNPAVYHNGQRQVLPSLLEESVEETCYLRQQTNS